MKKKVASLPPLQTYRLFSGPPGLVKNYQRRIRKPACCNKQGHFLAPYCRNWLWKSPLLLSTQTPLLPVPPPLQWGGDTDNATSACLTTSLLTSSDCHSHQHSHQAPQGKRKAREPRHKVAAHCPVENATLCPWRNSVGKIHVSRWIYLDGAWHSVDPQ